MPCEQPAFYKIVAVVVTYGPDLDRLKAQFHSLLPQVQNVVVVDNGSKIDISSWIMQWPEKKVHCIKIIENKGIGYAQNIGIKWAQSDNATHVLLMDHDSVPESCMVQHLLSALLSLPQAGAVGPNYVDSKRKGAGSPFLRLTGFRLLRVPCGTNQLHVEVDHLIASGCLIPVEILKIVGSMRGDFFIDFIDIEWCLRLRRFGYKLYGVCLASLDHRLGENPVRFLGRDYVSHSPERHYYQFRNAIHVYRLSWVPFRWRFASAWNLFMKACFYTCLAPRRIVHLKYILKGVFHGFIGRSGKYESK